MADYGSGMDDDWARERLEKYLALCEGISTRQRARGYEWDDDCRAMNDEATLEIPTISRIVRALDPEWTGPLMPPSYTSQDGERIVRQALGALRDRAEWETKLAPDSPVLQANQMHPLIWRAASTIWATGEYRMAIQQAAVALSAHVKAKATSRLNDRELVQQVFTPDQPKSDQTRLHFPGDPADKNWQSRQQGLHLMAQGAFAGIRNIAAHDDTAWTEHEALEHLSVLSVVARWTDLTVPIRA